MAWIAPTTRATGILITASIWNTDIVDNLVALKAPPSANYVLNEGSDYTTTSTTFVDIDATNLALAITTTGGDVMVGFHGGVSVGTAEFVYFDIHESVGAARIGGDDGLLSLLSGNSNGIPNDSVGFVRLITGLSAAAHTLKLQWKVKAQTATLFAGAGTANGDIHPQFWAREVT